MIGKYIDFRIFIISLAVGLLFVYLYQPDLSIIYVYPTPDNVDNLQFKDKVGNCYKFTANEVSCPSDTNEIKTIPIQN
jgi:hypothetical protein